MSKLTVTISIIYFLHIIKTTEDCEKKNKEWKPQTKLTCEESYPLKSFQKYVEQTFMNENNRKIYCCKPTKCEELSSLEQPLSSLNFYSGCRSVDSTFSSKYDLVKVFVEQLNIDCCEKKVKMILI